MAFDPVQAAQVFMAAMSPQAMAKAIAYTHQQHWMVLWNFVANVVVAFIILKTGILTRMRDGLEKNRPRPVTASLLLPLVYLVLASILSLPWNIYASWYVEKSFDMTSQPLQGWLMDHAKSEALGVVFGGLFLWVFYFLLRRAKGLWPVWAGILVAAFAAVALLAGPIWIEPMFNKYTPAPNGPVRDAVVKLAKETGVPSDKIFIYDGSKQSNRYTANVSGLGGSARVAMSDVMFKRNADIAEVRGVVGHEMGHYMRQHALIGVASITVLAVVLFFLTGWLFPMFSGLTAAKAIKGIADPAGLPVLMITIAFLQLLATPAFNSLTRLTEADADNFSLAHAHEPDGLSKALVKTADYRAPQPTKLEEIIFYDHPSVYNRVLNAMRWKAAHMDLADKTAAEDAAIQKAADAAAPAATAPAAAPPAPATGKPAK